MTTGLSRYPGGKGGPVDGRLHAVCERPRWVPDGRARRRRSAVLEAGRDARGARGPPARQRRRGERLRQGLDRGPRRSLVAGDAPGEQGRRHGPDAAPGGGGRLAGDARGVCGGGRASERQDAQVHVPHRRAAVRARLLHQQRAQHPGFPLGPAARRRHGGARDAAVAHGRHQAAAAGPAAARRQRALRATASSTPPTTRSATSTAAWPSPRSTRPTSPARTAGGAA